MSDFGANEYEMGLFATLRDRDVDGILAGNATDDELADVAAFFRELRIDLEQALPGSVESQHLARIHNEARKPPLATIEPPIEPFLRSQRLQDRFQRLTARATIAAVSLAALAAFGGVAYAGALPAPVQNKVANIAHHLGLSLPGQRHHSKPHLGRPDLGTQPTSTVGASQGGGRGTKNRTQDETQTNTSDSATQQDHRQTNGQDGGGQPSDQSSDRPSGGQLNDQSGDRPTGGQPNDQSGDRPSGSQPNDQSGDRPTGSQLNDQSVPTSTLQRAQPRDPGDNEQSSPSSDTNAGTGQQGSGTGAGE